jgi:hypothetical protein
MGSEPLRFRERLGNRISTRGHHMWCRLLRIGTGFLRFPRPYGPRTCTILYADFGESAF